MTAVYAVILAMGVVILLLTLVMVGILRSHAEILRKLDALGMGNDDGHAHENQLSLVAVTERRSAADVSGISPDGEPVVVSIGSGTSPTLIAFLSTSCSSCEVFWENLDNSDQYFGGYKHRVLIVTRGEDEESPTRALGLRRGHADVIMSSGAWEEFDVPGAPYFAVVDPDKGLVGEGTATTFEALEEFLADSINDATWDARRSAGTEDPSEGRIDAELRAAGIEPGDPRLYPASQDFEEGVSE